MNARGIRLALETERRIVSDHYDQSVQITDGLKGHDDDFDDELEANVFSDLEHLVDLDAVLRETEGTDRLEACVHPRALALAHAQLMMGIYDTSEAGGHCSWAMQNFTSGEYTRGERPSHGDVMVECPVCFALTPRDNAPTARMVTLEGEARDAENKPERQNQGRPYIQ